jgi:hypothetical protein
MAADKTPKKPQEPRADDEQRSLPAGGIGTLKIRVFASEQRNGDDVVRRAKVTVTGPQGADDKQTLTGETNESGELMLEVPAGRWLVEASAFGVHDKSEWKEVKPRCETCVELLLDIDLHISTSAITEAGDDPKFHRAGTLILARAECTPDESALETVAFEWSVSGGNILEDRETATGREIHIDTSGARGRLDIAVAMIGGDGRVSRGTALMIAPAVPVPVAGAVNVGLRRSATTVTPDLPLWVVIRNSTDGLSFKNYQRYIDVVLCDASTDGLNDGFLAQTAFSPRDEFQRLKRRRFLPFCDSDAYRLLKVATEAFVMVNCGVALTSYPPFDREDLELLVGRTGIDGLGMDRFERLWKGYLERVNGTSLLTLPYLALIASKFPDARVKSRAFSALRDVDIAEPGYGLLGQKLSEPCLVELLWSYWHEEAMLVQSMNAISFRFQNRRARHGDPLANMEISPLRPLNNLLWGYIQDEQHRLTVMRRADEYDHQYGLRLEGRAAPHYRTADSRVQFLRAFHNLLHLSAVFFQKDDDTTVLADAFPVLNALKEVHLILSQGAHNQFGDLPVTARVEMLMQQWILARPEFADFLPTRAMVAYPEPWMDRVDAMKRLQGWSDVNVLHFRDLGVFGEKLLLTIRYGSWVDVHDPDQAKNWLRAWRPEIQGYIHAYRAVTGADVTTEPVNAALPSALLQQRLAQQPRARAYLGNPGL